MKRRRSNLRRRYGRTQQLSLRFNPTVRNVLGEERQIDKVWPGGEYNCPFCGYAAPATGCRNPACSAGEYALANPERTRHIYAEREASAKARKEEEARRERDREWSEKYRQEQQREQALKQQEVIAEANRRGACVHCALEGFPYRSPKYIKHRGTCPKRK